MDLRVGLGGISTGISVYYCLYIRFRTRRLGVLEDVVLLPGPPGWSGAKAVMSHTLPSTTIQQSVSELCLEISLTESNFVWVMISCLEEYR